MAHDERREWRLDGMLNIFGFVGEEAAGWFGLLRFCEQEVCTKKETSKWRRQGLLSTASNRGHVKHPVGKALSHVWM